MKKIIFLFFVLFAQFHLYATAIDSTEGIKRRWLISANPPISKWDIPLGDFRNISKPFPLFFEVGFGYITDLNIGAMIKLAMYSGVDVNRVVKYYQAEWFADLPEDVQKGRRTTPYEEANFLVNVNLFYSIPVQKNVKLNANIGCNLMEVMNILYYCDRDLFIFTYYTENDENNSTSVSYGYSSAPFLAPSIGLSFQYHIGRALYLDFGMDYLWSKRKVEATIESDIMNEPYIKVFKYNQDISRIRFGLGLFFWLR